MNELASVALLLVSNATSLEVRVPGPAGTLGGTLTLPGRGRAALREGYDRLPTQELASEVLAALCSWLRASLR